MYLNVDEVEFFNDIKNFDKPVLIKSGCKDMHAINRWNKEYLINLIGDKNVEVEVYDKEGMDKIDVKKKKKIKLKNFFKKMDKKEPPYYYLAEFSLESNEDFYYTLFDDIFSFLDSQSGGTRENLLFIGTNCRTGCHIHVHGDFILNQIVGEKIVYLIDYDKNYMTLRNFFSSGFNFSKENFFKMSHKDKEIYRVVLKPGDSLFIPPWWWHAVEGVDFSCSLTKVYERKDIGYLYKRPYLAFLFFISWILATYISFLEFLISLFK